MGGNPERQKGRGGKPPELLSHPSHAYTRKVADEAEKLRKIADTSEIVEREGKEHVVMERDALFGIINTLLDSDAISRDHVVPSTIEQILANTEDIKKKLEEKERAPQKTWSQIVAQAPTATPGGPNLHAPTKRRDREITVTIGEERQREQIRNTGVDALLEAIRRKEPRKATEDILTVRKLPSGDLLITTTRTESRLELEKNSEWLQVIAPSARVKRTTFAIFAHSIRKNDINVSQQLQAATKIQDQNRRLHPELEVLRVSWPKGSEKNGKLVGSLIIEVPTATAANRIITDGLVFNHEIKECERFVKEARVTQCFNCQRFGHIARVCKNNSVCANCAEHHSTRDCSLPQGTTRKCALCKGNHGAWDKRCHIQKLEMNRARDLKESAFQLYSDASRKVTKDCEVVSSRTTVNSEVLVAKQRGRPTGLATAARDPRQTHINAMGKRTASNLSPPPARERTESPSKRTREDTDVESSSRDSLDYE